MRDISLAAEQIARKVWRVPKSSCKDDALFGKYPSPSKMARAIPMPDLIRDSAQTVILSPILGGHCINITDEPYLPLILEIRLYHSKCRHTALTGHIGYQGLSRGKRNVLNGAATDKSTVTELQKNDQ